MKRRQATVLAAAAAIGWAAPATAGQAAHPAERELERTRATHAEGLLELSRDALGSDHLLEAERLYLTASRVDPSREAEADALQSTKFKRGKAVNKGQEKERRTRYLASKEYRRRQDELRGKRSELERRILDRYLGLADAALRHGQSRIAEAALWEAYCLDPDSQDLRRTAGSQKVEELEARRTRENSIDLLELGAATDGRDIELDALRGKVVLWRSHSL